MTALDEVTARLTPLGWVPTDRWDEDDGVWYALRVDDQITFELGLDVTPRGWGLSLNPALAVRHAEVARLSGRFLGLPAAGAALAGTTLRDLVPQPVGTRWMFDHAGGAEAAAVAADEVVHDLRDHGMPWLLARTTLPDLIALVSADPLRTPMDDLHLAVAHAVAGDLDAAERALRAFDVRSAEHPPLAGPQAEQFKRSFREHFGLP